MKRHPLIRLALIIFILSGMTSCVHEQTKTSYGDIILYADLKTSDIASKIQSLEDTAQKHPDASVRAKANLELAVIYSHYKNPAPNYQLALKRLETFISLDPETAAEEKIQNWLSILREIDKTTSENKNMKQKVAQLIKENKDLRDVMEQVKNLDILMEEKRKKIK